MKTNYRGWVLTYSTQQGYIAKKGQDTLKAPSRAAIERAVDYAERHIAAGTWEAHKAIIGKPV